ncbi:MAG: ERAP1-like C-terminal domain-containing protein, partial [Promethearchaeota archaeon]
KGEQVKINPATAPIIYSKGGCCLRMIKEYLGDEKFQKGIHHFLTKHKFENAVSDDYWRAIEEATGEPISQIIESWVHQPGFPLITARKDGKNLILKQSRFSFSNTVKMDNKWSVPLKVAFYDDEKLIKEETLLMRDERVTIPIPDGTHAFKVNSGNFGFYRVEYQKENLEALKDLIRKKILPSADRFGIQNDLFALVKRCSIYLDDYLDFIECFVDEDKYLPLVDIASNLSFAFLLLENKRDDIASTSLKILKPALNRVGMEPGDDDTHAIAKLRSILLWVCFRMGDPEIRDFGLDKFGDLMQGKHIHPDLLETIMKIGASATTTKKPNGESFEWFRSKLADPKLSEQERKYILTALGNYNDENDLANALSYILANEKTGNRFITIIHALINPSFKNHAWGWFLKTKQKIDKLHPNHQERIIAKIISIAGLKFHDDVTSYFIKEAKEKTSMQDTINMAFDQLKVNMNVIDNNQ